MKQFIIILLAFLLITNVKAQSYYTFPKDSATWSVQDYTYSWVIWEPDMCRTIHYGLIGDTLIDGKVYQQLFANNLGNPPYEPAFNPATAQYVTALREDTNKKVWIRDQFEDTDILYYDFALQVEDTFCFTYFGSRCDLVWSIDSVLINGSYRKQFYFSNNEKWVEGIGSLTGWFRYPWISNTSSTLLCYSEKTTQLYGGSGCYCNTFSNIMGLEDRDEILNIYPNPVSEELFIRLKLAKVEEVSIYSNLGEKLRCFTIKADESFKIDIKDLAPGIYLVHIKGKSQSHFRKIIKI